MSAPLRPGHTAALQAYLDAAPVPWFAVDAAIRLLEAAGFVEQPLAAAFERSPAGFVRSQGSLLAWRSSADTATPDRFRIAAAHTDSPGLRIKPDPQTVVAGCVRLGVEVYGGPLLNSWLDRDLGLAGTVLVAEGGISTVRPLIDRSPVLRIPQLAIHLDRGVNETGLKLDRQEHLQPIWGLGDPSASFRDYVAELAGVEATSIRGFELAPFDLAPATVCGRRGEFLASARLDDLLSCHAALEGLIACRPDRGTVAVVALVDHEEVGSVSATGAASTLIPRVLERIAESFGGDRAVYLSMLGASCGVSLDMAHATHPNHPARHDPSHPIILDGGPVIKHNAQQRYATNLTSMAPFVDACVDENVPVQHFVSHSEMPCGSTIGPALAAGLGIPVVDVGVAQLAMHSTREMCGSDDHGRLVRALTRYLSRA